MPVFQSGPGQAPDWCELRQFDIIELLAGAPRYNFDRIGAEEKLIVGEGICTVEADGCKQGVEMGANIDLTQAKAGSFSITRVDTDVTLIRMAGKWGEELGGSGLFSVNVAGADTRDDRGDAVDYEKQTSFDCHFHDCDEYWILFQGSGMACSEGESYEVAKGDCLATGMGHHHDFPIVHEPVRAVFFETTMQGQKRRGHLWDHTHGLAQPQVDRI